MNPVDIPREIYLWREIYIYIIFSHFFAQKFLTGEEKKKKEEKRSVSKYIQRSFKIPNRSFTLRHPIDNTAPSPPPSLSPKIFRRGRFKIHLELRSWRRGRKIVSRAAGTP